jgi:hypothetical protein
VEKVEISLDGGATWREATCMSTETPTTHGKRWCWVLWSLHVSHADVSAAASLKCRATAAGGATQQEGLAWNAQGLCNNCIFTVKVCMTITTTRAMARLEVAGLLARRGTQLSAEGLNRTVLQRQGDSSGCKALARTATRGPGEPSVSQK